MSADKDHMGRDVLRPRRNGSGAAAPHAVVDPVLDAQAKLRDAASKLNSINTATLTVDEYGWIDDTRDDANALGGMGMLLSASDPNAVDAAMTQAEIDAVQATKDAIASVQGILWNQLDAPSRRKVVAMLGRIDDVCRGVAIAVTRKSS